MGKVVCGIYKITNLVNSKIYIGQSINIFSRWGYHRRALNNNKHVNKHLQRAWNQYGEQNFVFSIVLECNYEDLNKYESYYILKYRSYDPLFGYNKTFGGEGEIPTEEIRQKKSLKFRGKNNPMYGRCGELNPVYGKPKSQETIQKLRDAWDDERKQEQSIRVSGENNPMSGMVGCQNPASKKVVCIETGDVFETMKDAAKWCGLKTHTNISNVCNGKRKHAGLHPQTGEKLTWKYIE